MVQIFAKFTLAPVSEEAANIALCCTTEAEPMEDLLVKAKDLLRRVKKIPNEPQHGLPDVFVWMISGNRRVAYTR